MATVTDLRINDNGYVFVNSGSYARSFPKNSLTYTVNGTRITFESTMKDVVIQAPMEYSLSNLTINGTAYTTLDQLIADLDDIFAVKRGSGGGGDITVVDNLNSTSSTNALSANQGNVLNGRLSTLEQDAVVFNTDDNIILRPGTKIAGGQVGGGTTHEMLGRNQYTDSNGTYNQFEVGVQEDLFNINMKIDPLRNQGRIGVDRYDENDVFIDKKWLAYDDSNTSVTRVWATGVANLTLPSDVTIIAANYNRLMLFESDWTYTGTTFTVTNTDITGTLESTDKIEVTYIS